mmetsp:Transcript_4163/g.6401  ORF Transcript_4163/g.6401 Transcript_4163/m.6401 type:complete len:708 (-) Transcript_4163:225-2348(-)
MAALCGFFFKLFATLVLLPLTFFVNIILNIIVKIFAGVMPLLFVSPSVAPILLTILLTSSSWAAGLVWWSVGVGVFFFGRVLFTLQVVLRPPKPREWGGYTHTKSHRLKPLPNQRLSGKKWRAMKRRQRRNLLEHKHSEEDQRHLSGRIYLNRAADTKLRKMRWKLQERINRLKAKLAKMQAKCRQEQRQSVTSALGGVYREAYEEAFQYSPVIFDWSPTFNPYGWWSPRAEETYTSESYVDPTSDVYDELADERGGKTWPYSKHNLGDVAALVAKLDGPTKLVANFVANTLMIFHQTWRQKEMMATRMPTLQMKEMKELWIFPAMETLVFGTPVADGLHLWKKCGLKQSCLDPCLFIGEKVVAVCYVDDILFLAKDEADIEKLMVELRNTGLLLEKESSAAGFLGVDIKPLKMDSDGNAIELELTQCGLIDRIITNMGLDSKDHGKATPTESKGPLTRDLDGEPCMEDFSYPAIVGQLLYLTGHTRPELAYAVNQCARYMFNSKRSHELALLRIGKYLKATRTKGIVIKPTGGLLNINAYPDADFAGLYGHENDTDPACVKSRTGFVILAANCPISWKSSLQTKTALSTMEAEISALAHCMKELVGIMDLAKLFSEYYGLEEVKTKVNITIHEDNSSALELANTIPPEYTSRSKFYHIETIWFREQIVTRGIEVVKIETTEQLGDIFTKGLTKEVFEYLRKKLCGW